MRSFPLPPFRLGQHFVPHGVHSVNRLPRLVEDLLDPMKPVEKPMVFEFFCDSTQKVNEGFAGSRPSRVPEPRHHLP